VKMKTSKQKILSTFLVVMPFASTFAEDDFRGLWVGQATLTHVNEVSIPLDKDNHAIAPDPNVPTPTADAANLRLILHVDGEGQVRFLKDVAVLRRAGTNGTGSALSDSEDDIVLVSDERLYSEFPAQEASRIASAAFDFGDFKATEAVDSIVDAIAEQVAQTVLTSGINSASSTANLRIAEDVAENAATAVASPLISEADVATAFDSFMVTSLTDGKLQAIAAAGDPATEAADVRLIAAGLTNSFYGDTRAVDAVDAVVEAVLNEPVAEEKLSAARFIASRYADTENLYQRFITGNDFGDMIPAAAQAAATEAISSNSTPQSVSNAVYVLTEVSSVEVLAGTSQVSRYSDTSAEDAVARVLDAIISAASGSTNDLYSDVVKEVEIAGVAARAAVPRFSIPVLTPTADYNTFVQSDEFSGSVSGWDAYPSLPGAAEAAVLATVAEKQADLFATSNSLFNAARIAATDALQIVYSKAAQARRTELPMVGTFGPGNGDTNLTINAGAGSLGPAGLVCEISLPASHPTNPFRHPKHPDHTVGINITRIIRLDFNGELSDALTHSDTGLDSVTGIYREEIFGLHKPLGANRDIGLKVEGTFELNRISLIDTLNSL